MDEDSFVGERGAQAFARLNVTNCAVYIWIRGGELKMEAGEKWVLLFLFSYFLEDVGYAKIRQLRKGTSTDQLILRFNARHCNFVTSCHLMCY